MLYSSVSHARLAFLLDQEALLSQRRSHGVSGGCRLDDARQRVVIGGEPIRLAPAAMQPLNARLDAVSFSAESFRSYAGEEVIARAHPLASRCTARLQAIGTHSPRDPLRRSYA